MLFTVTIVLSACGVEKDCTDDPYGARVAADYFVEQRINQPGLDFPSYGGYSIRYMGNNRYTVSSYVDGKNAFGGPVRQSFTAVVECRPNDWKLHSLNF